MAAICGHHIGVHAEYGNKNPDLIGTLDETTSEYKLSSQEANKIHKRYNFLSQNRTDHIMRQRKEKMQEKMVIKHNLVDTHKPKLSKKSLEMAN